MEKKDSTSKMLPSSPSTMMRVPMARRGYGSRGQRISLLTNHFKAAVLRTDGYFYHYSVSFKYEDDSPADAKDNGRSIMKAVQDTYGAKILEHKSFAYDGEKSLFTVGPLPQQNFDFTVVLTDISSYSSEADYSQDERARKKSRGQPRSKQYKVAISYAATIPMQAIANVLRGQDSEQFQEAVRVLDIILRQHAAQQGCLVVRQSFFHNDSKNDDLGGGVLGYQGFHSGFRATQSGLSLNMDVSTTMIVKPGPVIDFLLENQRVNHRDQIDWNKAKRMLKNLRIKTLHSNTEFKIRGLSEFICGEQMFMLKERRGGGSEVQQVEISVYDYFVHKRNIRLQESRDLRCINAGKQNRPIYIPIELCNLVSLQRYTKALSNLQRASLVEKSRRKPNERMGDLKRALATSNYANDPLLRASGISISTEFTQIEGRILGPPTLRVGQGEELVPRNGRWNFNNKRLAENKNLENWVIVNFSARCNMRELYDKLKSCGEKKGINVNHPMLMLEEESRCKGEPAPIRVNNMIERAKSRLGLDNKPPFILCILPERKNSVIYGPWKRTNLSELGIVTQCIAPSARINDQYLTNVLLKINAKLGGMNSWIERSPSTPIPLVSRVPTLIVGMDVSHGSPGRNFPSIAAVMLDLDPDMLCTADAVGYFSKNTTAEDPNSVVNSREWPSISRYRATVRSQSPKSEMIDCLFKKVSDKKDRGIFGELLDDFFLSSGKRKPHQIIIFRDGVSESQFNQVLNIELEQIMEACKFKDDSWHPKFMVVVAQKRHHTKFFQTNSPDNVRPGTVIDKGVCHPRNYDFYMCAHAGMIGTTRPTHYHVLYDEIGCSPDELQEFVHDLSYVYQRSTTAISIVAPIRYAHLAAAQMSQLVKLEEVVCSDVSSSSASTSSAPGGGGGVLSVPPLPELHEHTRDTMFFC